jgi:hypothetical protein
MTDYTTKVQSNGKLKRGPVVEVAKRDYSRPFPDDLLKLADQSSLRLDDNDHTVTVYFSGVKQAAIWGPAVEGEWFAQHHGETQAVRVPTRDLALARIIGLIAEERADRDSGAEAHR